MSYADLHLHSTASDGTLDPAALVREVAERGAEGVSLTDHDTTAGLEEAADEARRLGLAWLRGCEVSAQVEGRSVHLLAYGIRPGTSELDDLLAEIREDRRSRAKAIVRRFNELGVPLRWEAVAREAVGDVPTRAHVARAIVDSGLMPDVQAVFTKYLGDGGPAHVEKAEVEPTTVFDAVHAAGGVVVLAHPGHAFDDDLIVEWAGKGLDGIEVMHPKNRGRRRDELRALAYRLDLLSTGGSDWHGDAGGGMEPGTERVPMRWMEAIAVRCGVSLAGDDG
ncbi:MAG: PHP domain-containing protein [Gemmatimonadota bacterium]